MEKKVDIKNEMEVYCCQRYGKHQKTRKKDDPSICGLWYIMKLSLNDGMYVGS